MIKTITILGIDADIFSEQPDQEEITPLVKSLSGLIDIPPDFDYQSYIAKQKAKKHK